MDKTYEELQELNDLLVKKLEYAAMEKRLHLQCVELSLINLLFCAIKNPYNGLSDSLEYNVALENLITIMVHNNMELGMEYDPTNVFVHDATETFEKISERIKGKLINNT